MKVQKDAIKIILDKEDLAILNTVNDLLCDIDDQIEMAKANDLEIEVVDENGKKYDLEDITDAYFNLCGCLL